MLTLLSTAPATLLDLGQLLLCLATMAFLATADVLLSPFIMNAIYNMLATCTMRDAIRALLWMLWQLLLSACRSPLPIAVLHGVLLMQVIHWLHHCWRLISAVLGDWLLSFVCGSTGGAGLFVSTLVSVHVGGRQWQKWTELLRRYTVRVPGVWNPTQGDLCSVGFEVSNVLRSWRRPLASSSAWLLRAVLYVTLLAHPGGAGAAGATLQAFGDIMMRHPQRSTSAYSGSFDRILGQHSMSTSSAARCESFTGFPLECHELERIRRFNRDEMPQFSDSSIARVRKAMNARGFHGHVWHVGHACPDPSKETARNDEDYGWNLFAQHAVDNSHLGHCLVSCAEAGHVGAHHVRCTQGKECVHRCS